MRATMRKKAGPVLAALSLIVVILLILVVGKKIEAYIPSEEVQVLTEYFGTEHADDVAIVWNQQLTALKGKWMDGRVYLDFDTLHDELNGRFYWDGNEKLLRYTTADDLVTVYADREDFFIGNDVTKGADDLQI